MYLEEITNRLKRLERDVRKKQILYGATALTGLAGCCHILGVDNSTGATYYKSDDGTWQLTSGGGGGGGPIGTIYTTDAPFTGNREADLAGHYINFSNNSGGGGLMIQGGPPSIGFLEYTTPGGLIKISGSEVTGQILLDYGSSNQLYVDIYGITVVGSLILQNFGVGTQVSPPTYLLGVNGSGYIVEVPALAAGVYIADNGLTESPAGTFNLGGTLNVNTDIDLAGNRLTIEQGSDVFLRITPTLNDENVRINAYNNTGGSNRARFDGSTTDTTAVFYVESRFDGGAKASQIRGNVDASTAILTYTADAHVFSDSVQFQNYGIGTYTGTPVSVLGVDASGNVLETSLSGSIINKTTIVTSATTTTFSIPAGYVLDKIAILPISDCNPELSFTLGTPGDIVPQDLGVDTTVAVGAIYAVNILAISAIDVDVSFVPIGSTLVFIITQVV